MKASKDDHVTIVGGGIAGLFAASSLLSFGLKNITIIEKGENLGGLLKSDCYEDPIGDGCIYNFDYGTHFVLESGNPNIDTVLKNDINKNDFWEFENSLPEGHILNHNLYEHSGCANIESLEKNKAQKIVEELKGISSTLKNDCRNLETYLTNKYGTTAVENIYRPALKKYTGVDLSKLDSESETTFCASRIIAFNRDETKKLKKDAFWDERIAFTHCDDGASNIKKFYPKSGGIQKWVDALYQRLKNAGVQIIFSNEVKSIHKQNDKYELNLSNDEKIETDFLIWTLPAIFLSFILNIKIPSKKPTIRSVSIIHIITDKQPIKKPFWITIYDTSLKSYRVTVYDNFQPNNNTNYRLSIEVIHDGGFSGDQKDQKLIFKEMISCGIIPENARQLWSDHKLIPNAFPVCHQGDNDLYKEQISILEKQEKNIFFTARFNSGAHGQIAIMNNIYSAMKKRYGDDNG